MSKNTSNKSKSSKDPDDNSLRKSTLTLEAKYSAPIPHSSEMGNYDAILPGSAERILSMAEREASHRHSMEKRAMEIDSIFMKRSTLDARIGLFFAFFAMLVVCGLGFYCIYSGFPQSGATIICTTLVGLAGAYIYGSRNMKNK